MKIAPYIALAAITLTANSGCTPSSTGGSIPPSATAAPAIDQANLCEVKAWRRNDVSAECKPGQKVVFLPSSFGNEQLPILFAAVNCDLRYSVALTTGAVTCIYGPITLTPAEPEQKRADQDADKP